MKADRAVGNQIIIIITIKINMLSDLKTHKSPYNTLQIENSRNRHISQVAKVIQLFQVGKKDTGHKLSQMMYI